MFPRMAASAANRNTFITSAIKFARDRGFGGIGLDWEYPNWSNASDTLRERSDFTTLVREMYPRCNAAGLLLTANARARDGAAL